MLKPAFFIWASWTTTGLLSIFWFWKTEMAPLELPEASDFHFWLNQGSGRLQPYMIMLPASQVLQVAQARSLVLVGAVVWYSSLLQTSLCV